MSEYKCSMCDVPISSAVHIVCSEHCLECMLKEDKSEYEGWIRYYEGFANE